LTPGFYPDNLNSELQWQVVLRGLNPTFNSRTALLALSTPKFPNPGSTLARASPLM